MAVLPIVMHPDPLLRAVCAPVTAFDGGLKAFTEGMLETMYAAPGRGLAAPQVGVATRVFVMDATWKDGFYDPQVFVNPVIIATSDTMVTQDEGCLSIPDQTVAVSRPDTVTLRWQGLDGAPAERAFEGFAAACVQHELDHLNGVLCIDPERAV